MKEEELERICLNCSCFFPATMKEPTEFGICLNDKAFEPFIDELLEDPDTAPCQDLINCKKFSGDQEACLDFEEIEEVEDSPLAEKLEYLHETGQINEESVTMALIEEQIRNIDWKTIPVDKHASQLKCPDPQAQRDAISNLGFLIIHRNMEAFKELFNFFKELPPPKTIEEVYFKKEILRNLEYHREDKRLLIPGLIDELYQTTSSNTTRQWISAIFKFLKYCPQEEIREPLERMLGDKRFSYRLKQKIKDILYY